MKNVKKENKKPRINKLSEKDKFDMFCRVFDFTPEDYLKRFTVAEGDMLEFYGFELNNINNPCLLRVVGMEDWVLKASPEFIRDYLS